MNGTAGKMTCEKIRISIFFYPLTQPVFLLGTGPKLHEIWHSGYYPVAWTNKKYRMIYFNMGHNDIDYENKTNKELSFTFGNEIEDRLIVNALLWLGTKNNK